MFALQRQVVHLLQEMKAQVEKEADEDKEAPTEALADASLVPALTREAAPFRFRLFERFFSRRVRTKAFERRSRCSLRVPLIAGARGLRWRPCCQPGQAFVCGVLAERQRRGCRWGWPWPVPSAHAGCAKSRVSPRGFCLFLVRPAPVDVPLMSECSPMPAGHHTIPVACALRSVVALSEEWCASV